MECSKRFSGSHSLDLLNQSLDVFLKTGVLNSPTFDKSLRDGKGDRSGWCDSEPRVLILEGWFVGCEPVSYTHLPAHETPEHLVFRLVL